MDEATPWPKKPPWRPTFPNNMSLPLALLLFNRSVVRLFRWVTWSNNTLSSISQLRPERWVMVVSKDVMFLSQTLHHHAIRDAFLIERCANITMKLALELENIQVKRDATESKSITTLADLEKTKTKLDTVRKDVKSTKATLEKANKKALHQDTQENCAMKGNFMEVRKKKVDTKIESKR
uniref:Uncharacterized protein n=1 Tax=Cannabis sativa TaxID=3483 RepID=A0A803PRB3_CANSA